MKSSVCNIIEIIGSPMIFSVHNGSPLLFVSLQSSDKDANTAIISKSDSMFLGYTTGTKSDATHTLHVKTAGEAMVVTIIELNLVSYLPPNTTKVFDVNMESIYHIEAKHASAGGKWSCPKYIMAKQPDVVAIISDKNTHQGGLERIGSGGPIRSVFDDEQPKQHPDSSYETKLVLTSIGEIPPTYSICPLCKK